ncbi:Transcription factor E2F7 [Armadillidium vulgare]|nr:Transcription factor E2F7 [Armadillidium vulgare]
MDILTSAADAILSDDTDENQAPTPKTPKNEQKFEFADSPVTPLSNLKMLTRIASMEEHIPSKKDLFSSQPPVRKNKLRRCVSDLPSNQKKIQHPSKPKFKKYTSVDIEQSQSKEESYKKGTGIGSETSRREKSLGLLCEKFLDHFPMEVSCLETPRRLIIDDVAAVLGTERRRVYDIVNILECLNMASRVQKNMYQWMGKQHLESTLSKLKGLAEDWGIRAHVTEPVETSLRNLKSGRTFSPNSLGESIADSRKEKSIGILCQKFLMLFLTSDPPHIIQLETANHLLLGQEGDDIDKLRKRGRRIYDIANVLVALRLITKLSQCKSFKYIGPSVYAIKSDVTAVNLDNKIKNRHSLLPPPILELVRENSSLHLSMDGEATPEDIPNGLPRNSRQARKLGPVFPHSKAKRNCLIARPQNIESLVNQTATGVKKCTSLENVDKVITFYYYFVK